MNPLHEAARQRLLVLVPELESLPDARLLEMIELAEALLLVRPHVDSLWTRGRLARYLNVPPKQLDALLAQVGAPAPVVHTRGVELYRAGDVFDFLDDHTRRGYVRLTCNRSPAPSSAA